MVCGLTMHSRILAETPPDKLASRAQKITIKLPWEIMTIYSDVLPKTDEEEDEDEDDDEDEKKEKGPWYGKAKAADASFSHSSVKFTPIWREYKK